MASSPPAGRSSGARVRYRGSWCHPLRFGAIRGGAIRPEHVKGVPRTSPTFFSTTGVKKRVACRYVSFGRTGAVPAPSDTAEALRLPYLRLCVLHHQGRAVVHDGVAHARRRPEMCQLQHNGHRLALARGGQASRLRRPRKLSLAPRRPVAPVRHPWAFRTDPPGPSSCPYVAECVGVFSEVRLYGVLRSSGVGRDCSQAVVLTCGTL